MRFNALDMVMHPFCKGFGKIFVMKWHKAKKPTDAPMQKMAS